MPSRTYARIDSGVVVELFRTDREIGALFHSVLVWVEVDEALGVCERWTFDGSRFAAPADVTAPVGPSLSDLQSQLRALTARVAAAARIG